MKTLSKRLKTAKEKVDFTSTYTIEKGMQLVKEIASAKFNESIEAHISLNAPFSHQVNSSIHVMIM